MPEHGGEVVAHEFVPISSVYRPIGQLYRPMAATICVTCGQPKSEHIGSCAAVDRD